jgi:hypothetical protein
MLAEPTNPSLRSRIAPALNEITLALLWPPDPCIVRAAVSDTAHSFDITPFDVTKHLFISTAAYFRQPQQMPACAKLVTFSAYDAISMRAIPLRYRYFRAWKAWPFSRCLLVWFALFLAASVAAWFRAAKLTRTLFYAAALLLTSFVTVLLNFFLTEFQTRYTLPMWEMLVLSFILMLGAVLTPLTRPKTARIASLTDPNLPIQ